MTLPKSEWIWHNGRLVPWDEAHVHVTTHALHYGSSVFEGLRAYAHPQGAAILGLEAHVRRLFDPCRIMRMELPYSADEVKSAIIETVRQNGRTACYIRPLAYKSTGTISMDARSIATELAIITLQLGRYFGAEAIEAGVDVMVSSWRRMAPSTLTALSKTGGNYVNSQFVTMEAADGGYMEGITLDIHGFVSEGSGENVFAVRDGIIYTPPVSASILLGITRGYVITIARELGCEVREETFPREMLYTADELFFTGTAVEISPIRSVDRIKIGDGARGAVTRKLQDEFFAILGGEKPDRHGWLTLVH